MIISNFLSEYRKVLFRKFEFHHNSYQVIIHSHVITNSKFPNDNNDKNNNDKQGDINEIKLEER